MSTKPHFSLLATSFAGGPRPRNAALIIAGLWLAIFFAALFTPPLLDDADATHAQAAQHIALTGSLVTLRVDGVRYLEKAPLPYWLAALSFRIFGFNTFAAHLPQALAVLLLALLGHRWANQAFGARTAFYTAIAVLTATGTFLFTRILIPEALLSLLLATALFAFLKSLIPNLGQPTTPGGPSFPGSRERVGYRLRQQTTAFVQPGSHLTVPHSSQSDDWVRPTPHPVILSEGALAPQSKDLHLSPATNLQPEIPAQIPHAGPLYPYLMWSALALAVLTKGLVALVFFFATTVLYLLLTGTFKASLPRLKPLTGLLLFLIIAAPWHILAALHNPATATHHGFLWFYFWNEHVLRFLGRRTPADFNRLPGYLYWTLHLVWLFPWSLFLPLGFAALTRRYRHQLHLTAHGTLPQPFHSVAWIIRSLLIAAALLIYRLIGDVTTSLSLAIALLILTVLATNRRVAHLTASPFHHLEPQQRTILLLALFAAIVLLFFSLSTNQEYYTFPAYLPILLLTAATITRAEQTYASSPHAQRWINFAHAAFLTLGLAIAFTLAWLLFASRNIPDTADLGTLLAHRNVAANTLSLSHLFDLTTASFAALGLPAVLAIAAFLIGPAAAWQLRMQRRHVAATTAIAFTSGLFLVAAHLALARFASVLSSQNFAAEIERLESTRTLPTNTPVLIFGDQAYGSSLPFYLGHPVQLVDGRSTSMLFGSTDPDTAALFLTREQLLVAWRQPSPSLLFVPAERRDEALALLPPGSTILRDESGKLLLLNHR